jgi:hypothetical protein
MIELNFIGIFEYKKIINFNLKFPQNSTEPLNIENYNL